jgi:hypothetical protein
MTVSDLRFTDANEAEVENYRPLCGLAVTSCLFAVGAPLAVFSAYLLVLPPAGAVLALAALRRNRASGDLFSGRRLAIAALVISCFFGAWATAQWLGRPWVISSQARRFTDEWLQLLVDGKVHEAYQWSLAPGGRLAPSISLEAFYERNAEAAQNTDAFFAMLPFKTDAKTSLLKSFRFVGNDSVATGASGEDLIVHRYEIVHDKAGTLRNDVLLLTVIRHPPDDENFVHWQVREARGPAVNFFDAK